MRYEGCYVKFWENKRKFTNWLQYYFQTMIWQLNVKGEKEKREIGPKHLLSHRVNIFFL